MFKKVFRLFETVKWKTSVFDHKNLLRFWCTAIKTIGNLNSHKRGSNFSDRL